MCSALPRRTCRRTPASGRAASPAGDRGVVAGVRDYGNRMGIPTVNGALVDRSAYLGNPLVFCGTVGVMPRGADTKTVQAGRSDRRPRRAHRPRRHPWRHVQLGRTDQRERRSSREVRSRSATRSPKRRCWTCCFRPVTGAFSAPLPTAGPAGSARPWARWASIRRGGRPRTLPLKYEGLCYTEIWICEAQERMVLAVPPDCWPQSLEPLPEGIGRGDGYGPLCRFRPAGPALRRPCRRRPLDVVPARRPTSAARKAVDPRKPVAPLASPS